jgi:hypothetical protein
MKHLLTGVAMAAALAIAAPVWAQAPTPMSPGGNNPTSGSAGPFAPKPAMTPAKPMHHKPMHHVSHKKSMSSGDMTTEQLNSQELARITGGGGAPMPAPMPTPGGNNPTSGAAGPFAPPPPK